MKVSFASSDDKKILVIALVLAVGVTLLVVFLAPKKKAADSVAQLRAQAAQYPAYAPIADPVPSEGAEPEAAPWGHYAAWSDVEAAFQPLLAPENGGQPSDAMALMPPSWRAQSPGGAACSSAPVVERSAYAPSKSAYAQ